MRFRELYENALKSSTPVQALRDVVIELLDKGSEHEDILSDLQHLYHEFRISNRETEEDVIADVMDFMVGWCSPHMQIPRR
jgi:hypothetical protein